MWLIVSLAVSLALIPSLVQAQPEAGQGPAYQGEDSPFAFERAAARSLLDKDKLRARAREVLRDGGNVGDLVDALDYLAVRKERADIAMIVRHVGSVQPEIASAALEALRAYGRSALEAVDALTADEIDPATRKQVKNQLLRDHILACCRRDIAVNRFLLDYPGRDAELYSIKEEIDDLMMDMLRAVSADIRRDISGTGYYYYGQRDMSFLQQGALVVYALSKRRGEQIKRDFADIVASGSEGNQYWWGYRRLTIVSVQLCYFFAAHGRKDVLHRLISDLDMMLRWQQDAATTASVHAVAAGIYYAALGDSAQAMERIELSLAAKPDGGEVPSQVRYLKARIMMEQKDEGGALRELELAFESDYPPMLASVDTAFKPLLRERRFQALLRYCQVVSRALPEHSRPYVEKDATNG